MRPRPGDHGGLRQALAAYTVGALDPAERAEVEAHLQGCEECRDELAALAALPGLLSRLTEQEAAEDLLAVRQDHVERVVAAVAADHRQRRRRLSLWRAAAAAAVVLLVVVVAVLLPRPGPVGERFVAEEGDRQAIATVVARAWGMEVTLAAEGMPDEGGFVLWAVSADGHRAQVASWAAVDRPRVHVTGSCYLQLHQVTHLEITDPDDELVLTLRQ